MLDVRSSPPFYPSKIAQNGSPELHLQGATNDDDGSSAGPSSPDITTFLSRSALALVDSPIRKIAEKVDSLSPERDVITLGGGLPHPSTFPFRGLTLTTTSGHAIQLEGRDLTAALQYNRTLGLVELVNIWNQIIDEDMKPAPGPDRTTFVTTGAEFGSYLVLSAIIDPGDSVLISSPAYSPQILKTRALNANIVPIYEDQVVGGLSPAHLRATLQSWPSDQPKPKLLLVCPTGSNPSGANIPENHRKEIYELVCEHNLLLIEDDPYYFINYGKRLKTFLEYDVEGRVIRLDSLSKVMCPGLRIGFCNAPTKLVEVMERHYSIVLLNSCNLSQSVVVAYFNQVGIAGFKQHAAEISLYYKAQRDVIVSAMDEHLGDLASWIVPEAGMFVWLKIEGVEDTRQLANEAMDNGVAFVPGGAFLTDAGKSPYLRLAFSLVPEQRVEEAIMRLAKSIREFKQ